MRSSSKLGQFDCGAGFGLLTLCAERRVINLQCRPGELAGQGTSVIGGPHVTDAQGARLPSRPK